MRTSAGVAAGSSAALASTSLSGPSLAGGRILVSGWSAGSSTATLYALDHSTKAPLWNSGDLGGMPRQRPWPWAAAHVRRELGGTLRAFKSAGCGTSVCNPIWSSGTFDESGTTPPTLANGVVYSAAGSTILPGVVETNAFNANGCGSALCAPIAYPNYGGTDSQITVAAGTVYGVGEGSLSVSEP